MMDAIASPFGVFILGSLFSAGAVGAVVVRRRDALANAWSSFFAVAGSAWGILFAVSVLATGRTIPFSADLPAFRLLSVSVRIDPLSAFFILVISLISLFSSIYGYGYAKHFYKKYSMGSLGFFYHVFVLGMLLVVSANNALFFLIVWEIMSLSSYALVVYDRNEIKNVDAGFLYFVMTHVGTVFILFSFLLLYKATGSFDFEEIRAGVATIPPILKNTVFILSLIGFGTKAGIIPLHIWLPGAHPAAPSHVSALMSGVMIKTGIYMMIRMFLDLLQPVPAWWGYTLLALGAVSSLLGVLYALTEHDLKRLLAYHSIENIGIILLGIGSALVFASSGLPALALLALVAGLFHTLNHATFKSLLFLSAGSVIHQTHTRNMEEHGGLVKRMPQTAFFFLVGSMAISALPPFNGFFSEWLTFQSLFGGLESFNLSVKWIFVAAAGSLAFTGGLALACFVKAFGATFLARPRSEEAKHAKESSLSMQAGMAALALLSLLFGLFSGPVASALEKVGKTLGAFTGASDAVPALSTSLMGLTAREGFASVSAPAIFLALTATGLLAWMLVRFAVGRGQKVDRGATWDCGTDLTPRMEITSTGFARSIILVFKGVLKPSLQHEIEYHDDESRFLSRRSVILGVGDLYRTYFYDPISAFFSRVAEGAKKIQNGNVNAYNLYVLIALLIALFFAL